jgi:putative zinc finger/helix-turn-helix YgiT family protein
MNHKIAKYHYTESGLDNIYLAGVENYFCSCGETSVSIPSIMDLHDLIGRGIVNKNTLLTGKEIKFLRKNIGMSGKIFAKTIGIDHATLSRWENGNQVVSNPHDRLIRLTYSNVKGISQKEIQQLIKDKFQEINLKEEEPIQFTIPVKNWATLNTCRA